MGRTRLFRVINNRIQFRCSSCGSKRNMPIPPKLRMRSIRCQKCQALTKCHFNRRAKSREQRSGKIVMTTISGEELLVNLNDISQDGVGLDIPPGFLLTSKIKLGNKVTLHCNWNALLNGRVYFEVKNIQGRRVGLEKTC